jgi:hypothetical protein
MMSKQLENFMEQNKDAFNDYEPSAKLWDNLQKELNNTAAIKKQQAVIKKLTIYKWVAAASVTLLIGLGILFFTKDNTVVPPSVVIKNKETPKLTVPEIIKDTIVNNIVNPVLQPEKEKFIAKQTMVNKQDTLVPPKQKQVKEYDEVLAFEQTQKHFATLILYKQKEIKKLSKSDTAIYNRFSADMEGLNKSYKQLSKTLPKSNSKSALINAMIYNLQIQIDLLNKQLIILNKIESSQKKEEYENNILSI